MKTKLVVALLAIFLCAGSVFAMQLADPVGTDGTLGLSLVVWLTPVIVYFSTMAVRGLAPRLSGAVTVAIVVPLLSTIVSAISYFTDANTGSAILQIVLGCLAVFVNETVKQLKQI